MTDIDTSQETPESAAPEMTEAEMEAATAPDNAPAEIPAPATDAPVTFAWDDVAQRKFFEPEELTPENFVAYRTNVQGLCAASEIPYVTFADLGKELSPGFGIAVMQVQETVKVTIEGVETNQRQCVAITEWPVPTMQTILADETGKEFISRTLSGECMTQIVRTFQKGREKGDFTSDEIVSEAPFALADFVSRREREGLFKVYNEIAKPWLDVLRTNFPQVKFFKQLSPAILRDCLSNAAYAAGLAPQLESRGQFVVILEKMAAYATSKEKSRAIFDTWLETRDDGTTASLDEIDFSDLDASA